MELQREHNKLENRHFKDKAALEAKYKKLYDPLYSERCKVVTSEVEEGDDENPTKQDERKGVPDFWLTVMKNYQNTQAFRFLGKNPHQKLSLEIYESDEEALKYLKDIKWCRPDGPRKFRIDFLFKPNPFFKNHVLTIMYDMINEDARLIEKVFGTEINWHAGKCLTQKRLKVKTNGSKNTKPTILTKDCPSFFKFFSPPAFPHTPYVEFDFDEKWQKKIEAHYLIGSTIRNKIIPHAFKLYEGKTINEDEENEDDIFSEEDDEDGIFSEEDDDEEEDAEWEELYMQWEDSTRRNHLSARRS
uniref:Uncharacterized protein n=1 Tax=Avena sativa TaxID=4498 RepID=A0ACD5YGS5_AVESA